MTPSNCRLQLTCGRFDSVNMTAGSFFAHMRNGTEPVGHFTPMLDILRQDVQPTDFVCVSRTCKC